MTERERADAAEARRILLQFPAFLELGPHARCACLGQVDKRITAPRQTFTPEAHQANTLAELHHHLAANPADRRARQRRRDLLERLALAALNATLQQAHR